MVFPLQVYNLDGTQNNSDMDQIQDDLKSIICLHASCIHNFLLCTSEMGLKMYSILPYGWSPC